MAPPNISNRRLYAADQHSGNQTASGSGLKVNASAPMLVGMSVA
jgi:hypothetical protein